MGAKRSLRNTTSASAQLSLPLETSLGSEVLQRACGKHPEPAMVGDSMIIQWARNIFDTTVDAPYSERLQA
ncbi:hypothetical protein BDR06DRAFT_962434 [Suillus hirtellus]|nr:hypothetical protein BDR06DRAFT_962434 [Suillus hirtellus]